MDRLHAVSTVDLGCALGPSWNSNLTRSLGSVWRTFPQPFHCVCREWEGATWSSSDYKAIIGSYSLEQDTARHYYTP